MIEKYQRLFQLNVFHSYFQRDICRCLEFNADSATEKLMKRFRFIIRRQINGIGLYANADQSLAQLFSYIERATGQDSFCFEIRTNDPDFNFFTAFPPNWVGQLRYDSSKSSVANDSVYLEQELYGNAGTLCMGKVTLRFADILKFADETGFVNFDIRFEARATQWQYFVVNRSLVPLHDPTIYGKEQIHFEGPENVFMPNGQAALLFSSGSNLIPLCEEPLYKFDLVDRPVATSDRQSPPKVIVKGLPTPNPEWIGRVTGKADEQLSSPMYVYL